jgi:N utilization substance protein B
MISRRNIRVKVMQTIYTLTTLEHEVKPGEPIKLLQKHFEQSKDMLVYLTYFLNEVAGYAEKDAYRKSTKHLPTKEDLQVNTKISGNELVWKIREDLSFQSEVSKSKPENRIDKELVKKIYSQLVDSPEYKQYITTPERKPKEEKDILDFILNQKMLNDEVFISHLEEHFMNWDDDADMVIQVLNNTIQKPAQTDFKEVMTPDKWEFAKNLLNTIIEKEEHLSSYIVPRLKNWDAERIAALDMIIMKMGVAELLYFETIPPKVTINEYIDIAKEYSTQQSGQFVNGILDNIHKELVQAGKLHKTDFKKA